MNIFESTLKNKKLQVSRKDAENAKYLFSVIYKFFFAPLREIKRLFRVDSLVLKYFLQNGITMPQIWYFVV